jgi:hypothetical protein
MLTELVYPVVLTCLVYCYSLAYNTYIVVMRWSQEVYFA